MTLLKKIKQKGLRKFACSYIDFLICPAVTSYFICAAYQKRFYKGPVMFFSFLVIAVLLTAYTRQRFHRDLQSLLYYTEH